MVVLLSIKFLVMLNLKRCLQKNLKHFAVYAGSVLNYITTLYIPIEKVLEEPENMDNSSITPGTLDVDKIARTFSTDGVCKMEFYYTTVDEKLFHEQW